MPQIIRYGDPALRITPTFNGKRRPPVQRYGAAGNNPTDESKKSPGKPSGMAMEIITALMQMPLFAWLQQRYEEEQLLGANTLSAPENILASPIDPPRQQYARSGEHQRYDRPATDVAKYSKLVTAGRHYGTDRTMANVEAGSESRMMYQRHQASIKADCERARKLALREGLSYSEALDKLGVQSLALPS